MSVKRGIVDGWQPYLCEDWVFTNVDARMTFVCVGQIETAAYGNYVRDCYPGRWPDWVNSGSLSLVQNWVNILMAGLLWTQWSVVRVLKVQDHTS